MSEDQSIKHEIVANTNVPFTKTPDAAYTNSDQPYGDLDTKDIEQAGAKDLSKTLEQIETTVYELPSGVEGTVVLDNPPDNEHEWMRSDTGKWFYYGKPGKRYYQSGAIYQEGKGLVKPADNTLITKENAAEYGEKRYAKAQEKALEGMRQAIADNLKVTAIPGDEAKYWGIAVTEKMLSGERDSMSAARMLAEGPLELIGKRDAKVQDGQGNSISGDPVFVERVLAAIAKSKSAS